MEEEEKIRRERDEQKGRERRVKRGRSLDRRYTGNGGKKMSEGL